MSFRKFYQMINGSDESQATDNSLLSEHSRLYAVYPTEDPPLQEPQSAGSNNSSFSGRSSISRRQADKNAANLFEAIFKNAPRYTFVIKAQIKSHGINPNNPEDINTTTAGLHVCLDASDNLTFYDFKPPFLKEEIKIIVPLKPLRIFYVEPIKATVAVHPDHKKDSKKQGDALNAGWTPIVQHDKTFRILLACFTKFFNDILTYDTEISSSYRFQTLKFEFRTSLVSKRTKLFHPMQAMKDVHYPIRFCSSIYLKVNVVEPSVELVRVHGTDFRRRSPFQKRILFLQNHLILEFGYSWTATDDYEVNDLRLDTVDLYIDNLKQKIPDPDQVHLPFYDMDFGHRIFEAPNPGQPLRFSDPMNSFKDIIDKLTLC
ncbi:hypothetical protein WICPIJ_007045 [Wickerhamomyces pijperi]|uniref:Uncharacterized protein n=1 Tax=Wickerhamomyces pijperi TaxID=599730 RepID=A0A9P8Q396_WICPI|nr:hypothetical protein WICPIJ_007045 [Wickerhamomyces pijperi]